MRGNVAPVSSGLRYLWSDPRDARSPRPLQIVPYAQPEPSIESWDLSAWINRYHVRRIAEGTGDNSHLPNRHRTPGEPAAGHMSRREVERVRGTRPLTISGQGG